MAAPAYLSNNDATLARLIKDGAIFLREVGAAAPTGVTWTPTETDGQIGYYSEDGFTLSPQPGDETTIAAHNGDDVISEQAPGFWTVAYSGLEANAKNTGAYFDTEVDADGSVTVTTAAASKRYDLVTVGMDQKDRLIVVHYPNVQLNAREDMVFSRSGLLVYGMTFRTFRGPATAPYHFKAWGLVQETADAAEPTDATETQAAASSTRTASTTKG